MICHQLDEVILTKRKIEMTEITETVEIPSVGFYFLFSFAYVR